jgi:hypothetical protein
LPDPKEALLGESLLSREEAAAREFSNQIRTIAFPGIGLQPVCLAAGAPDTDGFPVKRRHTLFTMSKIEDPRQLVAPQALTRHS